MKKITSKTILISIFAFSFICLGTAHAQTTVRMTDYVWNEYSIKFKIPRDFKVKESDAKQFIASNYDINLSIYPRKGENLFYEGYKSALIDWVRSNKVVVNGDYLKVTDLNGFVGAMVDATKDGYPVFLMVVANPKDLDVSLYVWISYNALDIDIARDILESITPAK
jgi:hypothetical protein